LLHKQNSKAAIETKIKKLKAKAMPPFDRPVPVSKNNRAEKEERREASCPCYSFLFFSLRFLALLNPMLIIMIRSLRRI
jgi:hypothetical protein